MAEVKEKHKYEKWTIKEMIEFWNSVSTRDTADVCKIALRQIAKTGREYLCFTIDDKRISLKLENVRINATDYESSGTLVLSICLKNLPIEHADMLKEISLQKSMAALRYNDIIKKDGKSRKTFKQAIEVKTLENIVREDGTMGMIEQINTNPYINFYFACNKVDKESGIKIPGTEVKDCIKVCDNHEQHKQVAARGDSTYVVDKMLKQGASQLTSETFNSNSEFVSRFGLNFLANIIFDISKVTAIGTSDGTPLNYALKFALKQLSVNSIISVTRNADSGLSEEIETLLEELKSE